MMAKLQYDIVVVGGGHAGIEAALAAARLGCWTAMVTHDPLAVGCMPCNPAIGGLGKGQLVRELDVLGGQMGLAIDAAGIQFRVLNRRKGPAVQAPRAQADKARYQEFMAAAVADQPGLDMVIGDAVRLLAQPSGPVKGVVLQDGRTLWAQRIILCSGTFLHGLMHIGQRQEAGGRVGAASSEGLSGELRRLGLTLRRLKTGTPPRLLAESVHFTGLQVQSGDSNARPFSFRTNDFRPPNSPCWLTYTTPETHQIIRANLHRSPLYAGSITGLGPRYCPSIEDKVVRFADRQRHVIFLEPEGLESDEIYVNGLSTSLPLEIQEELVRSVPGLERARFARYGYAVEYDSVPSWQVTTALACKTVPGLYLAGQILGTSGYEEAAAQGLLAGLNAARSLAGLEPWLPARDEAYLGVLVDDLATKEITEPYRMFTSRAEHRLYLRCDNAEARLLGPASTLGLLSDGDIQRLSARERARKRVLEILELKRRLDCAGPPCGSVADLLRRPLAKLSDLSLLMDDGASILADIEHAVIEEMGSGPMGNALPLAVEAVLEDCVNTIKYSGYIQGQERRLAALADMERLGIPQDFAYTNLAALSHEAREKLSRMRPSTMGQAGRIDGVRSGDLAVLTVALRRWQQEQRPSEGGLA